MFAWSIQAWLEWAGVGVGMLDRDLACLAPFLLANASNASRDRCLHPTGAATPHEAQTDARVQDGDADRASHINNPTVDVMVDAVLPLD